MANLNVTTPAVPSESFEKREIPVPDSSMNKLNQATLDGPVAILWDIENCPVPSDVRPEDVAGNIRMALRVHPIVKGPVIMFSAYGDFNAFPRRLREGCQRTGVKLVDVPNGRKDAADKAILIDMFLFALDNSPPSSIMLISGDVDFAPALHVLGQRGYTVILVIPSGVGVSSALCNAGKFLWDWPSVARGDGFMPPARTLYPHRGKPADISGYFMGCHINDNIDGQNEEEAIVYRGASQSYYNSRDFSMVTQTFSECSNTCSYNMSCFPSACRSRSLPSGSNEVPAGPAPSCEQNDCSMWVQPGDLNGLEGQLIKLLGLSGGCLPLNRIPAEYQKAFGRPLFIADYGAFKLVDLFKKMGDTMAVEGKGHRKFVYLRNKNATPSAPPLILTRKDRKGKGAQDECQDAIPGNASSDGLSDEERVVLEEQGDCNTDKTNVGRCPFENNDHILEEFKYELLEILVSYACQIFLDRFEAIYQLRYKKSLDLQRFGVTQLEDLFDKLRDIVIVQEEPGSKKKFIYAVGG